MHNTSTKYKQMHNTTISWNDNWILIFIHFVCVLLESSASSSSSFMIASFLIQILRWIISSSRDQIFIFLIAWGIFFRWWDLDLQFLPSSLLFLWVELLHIPHRLRDLLWMVRAWSSIAPIFCSLIMSRASSSFQSLLKVITSFWHTFLSWINPTILGGHSRWISPLLHSSLLLLPLQFVLWFVKYDCIVSAF